MTIEIWTTGTRHDNRTLDNEYTNMTMNAGQRVHRHDNRTLDNEYTDMTIERWTTSTPT
ncbi:hypothetical protein DPMN_105260 [Dreissena polymorpha]|uniref:Uncharacterized protein n=1 Tax=Dreissena polymorpha TaxID=45954 RepID=A0A9D4HEF8_DREPO|nr:hypothetical protein DPMN_105260 [Dreissena polymorpha]